MTKLNCINLEAFLEEFSSLEQKMTVVHITNNTLEIKLDDANRMLKFYQTKEKSLTEVENEKLKNNMLDLRQKNEKKAKDIEAEVQQLVKEIRAGDERHQRELQTVRQQCTSDVEDAHAQALKRMEAKDAETKKLLELKEAEVEEMKKRLKEQERDRQSELLKLQMEFGAKLARVQSTAQQSQQLQQQHGSNLLPQSVFKRKLQFFQEEKNKEIEALRQRIKELEESQRVGGLKKRKI